MTAIILEIRKKILKKYVYFFLIKKFKLICKHLILIILKKCTRLHYLKLIFNIQKLTLCFRDGSSKKGI